MQEIYILVLHMHKKCSEQNMDLNLDLKLAVF